MQKGKINKSSPRPWSENEIKRLKRFYLHESIRSIADKLGRTYSAVAIKAHKLVLTQNPRIWSKRELNLLKTQYPNKTAKEIADQIGRPVQATRLRIHKLGLKKRFSYDERHRVVDGLKQKLCRKCGKWRGESKFNKNRSSKDELLGWCKECLSAVRKKRRLAAKN